MEIFSLQPPGVGSAVMRQARHLGMFFLRILSGAISASFALRLRQPVFLIFLGWGHIHGLFHEAKIFYAVTSAAALAACMGGGNEHAGCSKSVRCHQPLCSSSYELLLYSLGGCTARVGSVNINANLYSVSPACGTRQVPL